MEEVAAKYGKIKLIFDEDEYFPEDPGQGTPVMVVYGDWEYTATYDAAVDWKELDEYQLSDAQHNWLVKQGSKVENFFNRMDKKQSTDYIMTNKIDQFRIAKQSIEISKAPYTDLFYKFLKGEFSEDDFKEIYGPSLGSHFYARYDNGDGIVSLFRQFSGSNATPLLNLFVMERERAGAASFQVLKATPLYDKNGNSRKLINVYDARGKVKKVIKFSATSMNRALKNSGFNPKILAALPSINISAEDYNFYISDAEERNIINNQG